MNDSMHATPEPGDVLIRREMRNTPSYSISVVPGPPQFQCSSLEEAILQAQRFAEHEHLKVWTTEDGRVFGEIAGAGLSTRT